MTPPEMEHNSNLFGPTTEKLQRQQKAPKKAGHPFGPARGDASFLAIPAIHFFGFPGARVSASFC